MATFLGKVLLVAGLGFEAWTLYEHPDTISKFNVNYGRGLKQLPIDGEIKSQLADKQTIVRLVIVGLYALSIFIPLLRAKFIKFFVAVGVILNTLILANPWLDKSENAHFLLLQNLAIIGGLFYLLGEPTSACNKSDPVAKKVSAQNTHDTSSVTTKDTNKDKNANKKKKN